MEKQNISQPAVSKKSNFLMNVAIVVFVALFNVMFYLDLDLSAGLGIFMLVGQAILALIVTVILTAISIALSIKNKRSLGPGSVLGLAVSISLAVFILRFFYF